MFRRTQCFLSIPLSRLCISCIVSHRQVPLRIHASAKDLSKSSCRRKKVFSPNLAHSRSRPELVKL